MVLYLCLSSTGWQSSRWWHPCLLQPSMTMNTQELQITFTSTQSKLFSAIFSQLYMSHLLLWNCKIVRDIRKYRNSEVRFLKAYLSIVFFFPLYRFSKRASENPLRQTQLHGQNIVFLDFPLRRTEERSLMAPIIIMLYFGNKVQRCLPTVKEHIWTADLSQSQ